MSSEQNDSRPGRASDKRSSHAILWVGGPGLPGGSTGRRLVAIGGALHWEPISSKAAGTVASLAPVLVVIEAERVSARVRELLRELTDSKRATDMVVYQLCRRPPRRLAAGFDGALLKDASLVHQIQLVLGAMEGTRSFRRSRVRTQRRLTRLKAQIDRLRHLAVRDDLTRLYNLRFFNRSLETEHQRSMRFGRSYALVFLDLDGLREVNERRGHLAGAQVLRQVGELLGGCIRRIDLAARIGGDEFVVICPETGKVSARMMGERLRREIQKLQDSNGTSLGITTSVGVASFPDDGDLPDEVLQRADRALYEAKALGKNRVCCWGEFEHDDEESFLGSVHGAAKAERLPAETEEEQDAGDVPISTETLN